MTSKQPRIVDLTRTKAGGALQSYLLLRSSDYPLSRLREQFFKETFEGQPLQNIALSDDTLTFNILDELVSMAFMPGPFPWEELEGPCETSWMWPDNVSPSRLIEHQTHLWVAVIRGTSDPVKRLSILTFVTGIAAQSPTVSGIYWPQGTMVHYPPYFTQMAQSVSADDPPLYFWIDYRVQQNEDGSLCLFTTGMRELGLMELEVPRTTMQAGDLRDWCVNITSYLLENGPVLKNGDTLDTPTEERMRVRHRQSQFGGAEMVLRIDQDLRAGR